MSTNLSDLAHRMEYPGRFLMLGNTEKDLVGIYGVTARNEASRAKRYMFDPSSNTIRVETTDANVMSRGDLNLLDYTAARFFSNGIILGNGRQVDRVTDLDFLSAEEMLKKNLAEEHFESDINSTPRITGCSMGKDGRWTQALHLIRNDGNGASLRTCFPLETNSPGMFFLSTYAGPNIRPTPSFVGGPISLNAIKGEAKDIAEFIYDAFAPQQGKADLRVSVVVTLLSKQTSAFRHFIVNAADT